MKNDTIFNVENIILGKSNRGILIGDSFENILVGSDNDGKLFINY